MAALGLVLCLLIALLVWIGYYYENSQAAERPLHSSILSLLCAGLSLQLSSRFLPGRASGRTRRRGQSYSAIPLQDIGLPHTSRESSPIPNQPPPLTLTPLKRRLCFLVVVACIAGRVETFRRIVQDVSCTHRGVEVWLPTFLAVCSIFSLQTKPPPPDYDTISNSIFDDMRDAYVNSRLRYLLPTLFLSSAAHITSKSALSSTYICPILSLGRFPVPLVQYAGLCFDVVVITLSTRLLSDLGDSGRRSRRTYAALGLLSAAFTLALSTGLYITLDFDTRKSWPMDFSGAYLSSAFSLALMFSVVVHLLLYLAPVIRPLTLSVIVVFFSIYTPQIVIAFENRAAFPVQSNGENLFALFLAFLGTVFFISLEEISDSSKALARVSRQMPTLFMSATTIVFLITGIFYLARNNAVGFHPIDFLIYNARTGSELWLKQASSSLSLEGAVGAYKWRYKKPPPPNFDKWYEFAVQHQSMIIDDYDQIYEDLLPFWAMRPSEIRAETHRILSNSWNEIAGISVRNGTATLSPHVTPASHRWMVEGVALMINNGFSQWLPDMDLAFNLNDEPRVVVPFQEIEAQAKLGKDAKVRHKKGVDLSFSKDSATLWNSEWMDAEIELPDRGPSESPFQLNSFSQTFYNYGTRSCPPKSAALSGWRWNPSEHCASCAAPHSIGQFISNWTLSGDMCHQPDMANLHGFHLAPAAFKAANKLLPVFSQSKVQGYNDILYPSAWNYMDKAKYDEEGDPIWASKQDVLYWRGGTSEGVSNNGEWRGMERQRFVHLVNNITDNARVPMLINDNKLTYQNIPARDLQGLLHFNVSFVDHADRCGRKDCSDQNAEFNITEGSGVDFQEHWHYKYLMDMDGAAFSGRFVPFLLSRSLPFKAGIFREWYDARITAWLHFVPIDTRLHGLYATLAYFAGLGDGKRGFERVSGRLVQMEGRQDQAEWIAEQGRKWAEKVLRKEDMEIYFFRLLLEWGRLVDDRRDEIGFWLDEE